jgi:hypothetical protein
MNLKEHIRKVLKEETNIGPVLLNLVNLFEQYMIGEEVPMNTNTIDEIFSAICIKPDRQIYGIPDGSP